MATANYDRGRCLRYKSDLQKQAHLPPVVSTPPVPPAPPPPSPSSPFISTGHTSLLIWSFLSIFVLFIYVIYRRRQEKSTEEQERQPQADFEPINHKRDSSESHLITSRTLPVISEEYPAVSSSNNLNVNIDTISTLARNNHDSHHHSSLRQRIPPKTDQNELDDFVQIPPSSQIVDEAGHPIIFRKLYTTHENAIKDDYYSLEEINQAVKDVGLVRSQLIFGIDYTISNLETGKHSFNGLSLHHIEEGLSNPYQSVITIVGRTMEKFDSDSLIPAFGFGDRTTLDRKIFPLRPDGSYCRGFRGVLDAYNRITPKVRMSGPTNFAPLIKEAIRIVKKTRQYHILVIVADGQVTNERQTKEAIVEASNYPLSIVMVGVGDGPWDMMKEFDDSLPTRQFDNFQFVNYNRILQASYDTDADFALNALMEIPSQYAAIKRLGLLKDTPFD